jgi:tetratricopeptide (TPR) repeat protein
VNVTDTINAARAGDAQAHKIGVTPAPLPLAGMLKRLQLADVAVAPPTSLNQVRVDAHVIEDFRPLCESLEWDLAAAFWDRTGVLPFVGNSVPYLINNNGRPSAQAATILYAACTERVTAAAPVTVLEVGAGSGLFARYFLDAFRALCADEKTSFYDQLTYIVTDRGRRTVEQWAERDLFSAHPGRVILATCDASAPETLRAIDGTTVSLPPLAMVICNYVLDVLPAAVVRTGAGGAEQLCVRTHLTTTAPLLEQYSSLQIDELRSLAASNDPAQRARLLAVLTILEFEAAWRPISGGGPPHLAEALESGQGLDRLLLNHGALDALDGWTARLALDGCVLVRDYGPVTPEDVAAHAAPQRFGSSTAVGLNFPLLEHHLAKRGWAVLAPEGDAGRPIHVRLVCRGERRQLSPAFLQAFAVSGDELAEQPAIEALEHSRAGRNDEALRCFKMAVERGPRNWFVIGSASEFVGLRLQDFVSGLQLAQAAIELNPYYSAWLWNILGDCLYCLERFDEAHEAYLQAARIDPEDVRTNLNLAYTWLQRGRIDDALQAIALGLARDGDGTHRQRLLDKQQHVLATLTARTVAERERLLKRALAFA